MGVLGAFISPYWFFLYFHFRVTSIDVILVSIGLYTFVAALSNFTFGYLVSVFLLWLD